MAEGRMISFRQRADLATVVGCVGGAVWFRGMGCRKSETGRVRRWKSGRWTREMGQRDDLIRDGDREWAPWLILKRCSR